MPSVLARKVAGTYVEDVVPPQKPVVAWAQQQCRTGSLERTVRWFADAQTESLDPSLVVVEEVGPECIHCRIPLRASDHESKHTFLTEVRFKLNPATGETSRFD